MRCGVFFSRGWLTACGWQHCAFAARVAAGRVAALLSSGRAAGRGEPTAPLLFAYVHARAREKREARVHF